MACYYYDLKKGVAITSLEELIDRFYTENFELKNSAIYSAEDIRNSTVKRILKIKESNKYSKSNKEAVTTLITKSDPDLFRKIPGQQDRERLSPEYIRENRIYKWVKDKVLLETREFSDSMENLVYNEDDLNILSSKLPNVPINKLKYYLSEITDIINIEEKTTKFGIFLHNLISLKIKNSRKYENVLNSFINNKNNIDILGEGNSIKWKDNINNIVNTIVSTITSDGSTPISEIFIESGNNSMAQIKGKIDLVTVDNNGNANIFEIKISKSKYENWDSAKLRTLDWQLALYKQLLGQHINVSNTQLNVIPIQLGQLGNPNTLYFEESGIHNRRAESKELHETGEISRIADFLVKRAVIVDYDPKRLEKFRADLHELIPNFEIKTGIEDTDLDNIMKTAEKRFSIEKVWKKWNNFKDIPDLPYGYFTANTKEEFEKLVKIYVNHSKEKVNNNVSVLKDALISAIKNNTPIRTGVKSEKDLKTNHLLLEYLNDDWEVVTNIPETLPLGIIVLKNTRNGLVNVISLSSFQFLANSELKNKNYGDLEYLKVFLFLNYFKDELLPTSNDKIGEIIVFNPENADSYYRVSTQKFEEFNDRMYEVGLSKSLKIFKRDLTGIENIALLNLDNFFRGYDGSDKQKVRSIFSPFETERIDAISLEKLKEIQKEFVKSFGEYINKTPQANLNFEDPKEVLWALLQVAIISKSKMDVGGDFQNLSNWSLGLSDFKSLLAALYTDKQHEYDKETKKIQGIVQGLVFTTPDYVASKDLRNINIIVSTANAHIAQYMVKVSDNIRKHTKLFYESINFNQVERLFVGETQNKYKNLWLHENGKFSDSYRTKNPYKKDLDNILSSDEEKYLKNILFIINTFKLNLLDSEIKDLNPESLESIKKNEKIANAIEDGSYFEMPLVRREELSKYHSSSSISDFWQHKIKPISDNIRDMVYAEGLLKEDIEEIELKQAGFYEMYDAYGRHSPDFKAKMVAKYGQNYFEWNLDTIAHRVSFNKIRKNIFDNRLPIINAYIWWIKLLGGKQNIELSNQLEYITNQLKLAAYDQPIIDKEFKDAASIISTVKSISTAAMLGFRPDFFVKEMALGAMKGISLAATQIYGKDQFGIGDLVKAYNKLFTINNQFSTEDNLINKLNQYYRFANMDTNTIAKKMQSDRTGIMRGLGRYLYACNTMPDYYNRLSLFLAKMIHDGSYEAHTFENGIFSYDPRKDKRFSYYLENREKYKDKFGNYTSKVGDEKFNYQRNHYLLLIEQLNKEYTKERFKESDLIDKAYSEKERSSLKSFTDMSYGYYDKDAQSQITNNFIGLVWMQFMQFWPGKMKMWFGKPLVGKDSPIGRFQQKELIEDGVVKKLWRKSTIDENNNIKIDEVTENTGDPVLEWVGEPQEGLIYAVLGTLRDILKLDFNSIKSKDMRNRRTMYAIADGALMMIMFGIISALVKGIISEKGTDGIDGRLLSFVDNVDRKILNETNLYRNTLGAINMEPVFLSYGRGAARDIQDVVNDDKTIKELLTRNIGAMRMFE